MIFEFDKIYERDMDFLILEEFVSEPQFANIFLQKAGIRDATIIRAHHSLVDIQYGESDLEVLIENNGTKYAILIEDKIDAKAMPEQCIRYHERGKKRISNSIADAYEIFIVAPKGYLNSNLEAQNYPHKVSYEEMQAYFDAKTDMRSAYKSKIIKKALYSRKLGYVPIENVAITDFWKQYYDFKNKYYPELLLPEIKGPRGDTAIWPWFNTEDKRVKICHKSLQGYADLTLSFLGDRVNEVKTYLISNLDSDMKVVKTAKSASIRIQIPRIDFRLPFEDYDVEMHQSLKAVCRLALLAEKIDYDQLYNFACNDK